MYLKISALPTFREILTTRYKLLTNKIKGMKEIDQAKSLLNKSQREYYDESEKESTIIKSVGIHTFDVKAIQEKNRRKLEGR